MRDTNIKRRVIFLISPLSSFYETLGIKEGHWNPGNIFDEIHIITLQDTDIEASKVQAYAGTGKLIVHCLGKVNILNYWWSLKRIEAKIREINPTVIQSMDPFVRGWLATKIGKKLKKPVVITLHTVHTDQRKEARRTGDYFLWLRYLYVEMIIEKYVLRNADNVICVCESIADRVKKLGAKNVSIIYNNIERTKFSPDLEKKFISKKPTIIFASRMYSQKDPCIIIRAVKDMDVDLILAGAGEYWNKAASLIKELGLEDKVKMFKMIPNGELGRWFASCDILVQPMAHVHGIPRTTLEGLASGIPVVTPHSGVPNTIEHAVLLSKNEPKEYRKAFEKILAKDGVLRKRLIKDGLDVISKIDKPQMVKKEIALYQKLFDKYQS